MKKTRVLIKLGGSSLQDDSVVLKLAELVKLYQVTGTKVFIVHGGGPAINAELTARGISWTFLNGQRVTTPEMISTIEMVLKGSVNGKVVRVLNQSNIAAIGISGSENGLLQCEQASPELQRVGRITKVNTQWLEHLAALPEAPVPVIAPLGVGKQGEVFNINADWSAAQIAISLKVDELVYLTDQSGILDANKHLLSRLTSDELQNLIDTDVVSGGMLAKTQTILAALGAGIKTIRILHAEDAVRGFQNKTVGTHCVSASEGSTHATI